MIEEKKDFLQSQKAWKGILVVCSGNIYRSPIAAAFIRQAFQENHLAGKILVATAGLDAPLNWSTPAIVQQQLLESYGLDLSTHRSRPLTSEVFLNADLVLAMEQKQLMRLAQQFPRHARKLKLLSELEGQIYDVSDPVRNPEVELESLVKQLQSLVSQGLDQMLSWLKV